jgi:hypothetical protein
MPEKAESSVVSIDKGSQRGEHFKFPGMCKNALQMPKLRTFTASWVQTNSSHKHTLLLHIFIFIQIKTNKKNELRGLSPRATYTDRSVNINITYII